MTDTITSADRKADLKVRIARLDRKINEAKCEIANWQDELDDLETERAASLDEFDDLEGECEQATMIDCQDEQVRRARCKRCDIDLVDDFDGDDHGYDNLCDHCRGDLESFDKFFDALCGGGNP
jgi:hypothetical protein